MSASDGSAKGPAPRRTAPSTPGSEFYWQLDARLPAASEELWALFCLEQGALGAESLSPFAAPDPPAGEPGEGHGARRVAARRVGQHGMPFRFQLGQLQAAVGSLPSAPRKMSHHSLAHGLLYER